MTTSCRIASSPSARVVSSPFLSSLLLLLVSLCLTLHFSAAASSYSPRRIASTSIGIGDAPVDVMNASFVDASSLSDLHSGRHLLQSAFPSSLYPSGLSSFPGSIQRWTSCFPLDDKPRSVSLGLAVDVGLFQLLGSDRQSVVNFVSAQLALVNRIYLAQMGLQFVVGEILIMEETGTYEWNHLPSPVKGAARGVGVCGSSVSISSVLDEFSAWRISERPSSQGLWHLLTNCFPPPGTVGLSFVSGVCKRDSSVGVSSFSSTLWLTLAHELGHNLGALHSFQLGQGKTGGIMDYADGSMPVGSDNFQFNSVYSKQQICDTLTTVLESMEQGGDASAGGGGGGDPFHPYCIDSSRVYAGHCGNGILEVGEQCDDDSLCCDLKTCTLGVGFQCSPGNGAPFDDSTCCQNCKFVPSSVTCQVAGAGGESNMRNAAGYCSNGVCRVSSCADFHNQLEYCGTRSDNPCRQTCRILTSTTPELCTDGFSTPNVNVPEGTVCKLFPWSTCQWSTAGSSTAPSLQCLPASSSTDPTYTWVMGPWSTCLGECGMGTIERSVSCVEDQTGNTALAKLCTGEPPIASSPCVLMPCPSYAWSTPAWSPCDTDCGHGLQHNRPLCLNTGFVQPVSAPVSFCSHLPSPKTTQACVGSLGAQCPLSWRYTSYSPCTQTCGGGVKYSRRSCVQTRNTFTYEVDDAQCTAANVRPTQEDSVACNEAPCPPFYWQYGIFDECSASCGGGTQQRTATCMETATEGPAMDASKCSDPVLNPLGQEPLTRPCQTQACPSYAWVQSSSWSDCSVACGGGEQYALIQCFDTAQKSATSSPHGVAVSDQYCTQSRPLGTRSCHTQACPDYHYRSGVWSACSVACGGGTMTRKVSCHNMQGVRMAECTLNNCPDVDDHFCLEKGLTPPPSSSSCNQQTCTDAMWWSQDWGDCSASCDGGTQTRVVNCVSTGTYAVLDASRCGGSKPSTSQPCNMAHCASYQWVPSPWTACSAVCGGGRRTRKRKCIFGGSDVPDELCLANNAASTPTEASCNTQACSTFWWTSDFGECSKACEYGSTSRRVECRMATTAEGVLVPDEQCTAAKPADVAVCNVFPCPAWVTSDWSECSVRCGDGGMRTRTAICLSYDNRVVDSVQCVHNLPSVSEPCRVQVAFTGVVVEGVQDTHLPCPHWHRSEWGDCSKPCGGGTQNRTLMCRMPHDEVWQGRIADDPSLCPAGFQGSDAGPLVVGAAGSELAASPGSAEDNTVPATSQTCNTEPCREHYWHAEWDVCSAKCGGGVQTSTLSCLRSRDGLSVSQNLCLDARPATSRPCNTHTCAAYEWFNLTSWSSCSVHCGVGVQVREVRCRDTRPPPLYMVSYDLADDAHCAGLTKPPSQRDCEHPPQQCFGWTEEDTARSLADPTVASSLRVNGRCSFTAPATGGECVCRAGFGPGGSSCSRRPFLRDVAVNSLQYTEQGIPFGETVQVTWMSSPDIEYVSVMLVSPPSVTIDSDDSPPLLFPQYIAARVLNNGSMLWRVGSRLSSGIGHGGPGFQIRVMFQPGVSADSPDLKLANPCGYVSCGSHGTCGNHGKCKCKPGWSGAQCELAACQNMDCNLEHSTCEVAGVAETISSTAETSGGGAAAAAPLEAGEAYCRCKDGWSGSQCYTPPGCADSCEHGGDYLASGLVVTTDDTAATLCPTTCACTDSWDSATQCSTCALSCRNGGMADASCSHCQCGVQSGFFGSQCQCSYYLLTLKFRFDSASMPQAAQTASWSSSPASLQYFSHTLNRDFARALGIDSALLHVSVDSIVTNGGAAVAAASNSTVASNELLLDVRFAKVCEEKAFDIKPSGGLAAWSPRAGRRLLQDGAAAAAAVADPKSNSTSPSTKLGSDSDLLTLYTALSSQYSDLSSPLYRGLLSGLLDASQPLSARDPSGRTALRQPSPAPAVDPFQRQAAQEITQNQQFQQEEGGTESNMMIIIIAVVAGAVVVGAGAGVIACRARSRSIGAYTEKDVGAESPMGYDPELSASPSPEPTQGGGEYCPSPTPDPPAGGGGYAAEYCASPSPEPGLASPSMFGGPELLRAFSTLASTHEQQPQSPQEGDEFMVKLQGMPQFPAPHHMTPQLVQESMSNLHMSTQLDSRLTPATSASNSASTSAQVSRRGSLAGHPLGRPLVPDVVLPRASASRRGSAIHAPTSEIKVAAPPTHSRRSSLLQPIRIVRADAPVVCASPSALEDEAVLDQTFRDD